MTFATAGADPCASATVDVIVVSFQSRRRLYACVEPLVRLPGVRVIVVDNASPDGSLDAVAGLSVDTIRLPRNGGFAYGCNVGWRAGSARYVLLLNPDARIDGSALQVLVDVLEREPRTGVVGPRVLTADGTLDWSQRRFPRLRSTYARALFLHRLFPRATWSDEIIRNGTPTRHRARQDWISGACMLVRREALTEIDGLDEGIFLYSEDVDLCRRLRDAGWAVRFEPEAVAEHEGGGSAPREELRPMLSSSRARYAQKHRSRLAAFLERLGLTLERRVRSAAAAAPLVTRLGR